MFRLARFYSTRPPSPPRRIRTRTVLYACTAVTTGAAALYLTYPTQRRAAPTSATLPLERNHWTPVTVKFSSATLKGSNSKLITLSLPPALIPKDKSPVFSIFVKDDDIQVERPYTPLTGIEPNGDIHLWVKKYERGEVGRWLHSKKLGEQIEIRGPDQTFEWAKDQWDDIIMISGGTGLTPFYQLLHQVFSHPQAPQQTQTHFTLLHSSSSSTALPPHPILSTLQNYAKTKPERFTLRLFVDKDDTLSSEDTENLTVRRVAEDDLRQCLQEIASRPPAVGHAEQGKRILFLVCGPGPMVTAIAGRKTSDFAQGPVGGILGKLGLQSSNVWKL